MRSVYIAGIKYNTVSSGAMFCLPITRFHSQLFLDLLSLRPIQTSGLQPRQVMWMSFSVPCLRAAAVQKFPRRPLKDGGVPRCSLESMTQVSNYYSLTVHPVTHPSGTEGYFLQTILSRYPSRPRMGITSRLAGGWQSTFASMYRCCKTSTCVVSKTRRSALLEESRIHHPILRSVIDGIKY
jgi:hypothetical protein